MLCSPWLAFGLCFPLANLSIDAVQQPQQKESKKRRPNLILIMADDLGFESLGCNGGRDYATPNLDRLAAEGMRFTQCYSNPVCTPSRVQIMTGRYSHRNYQGFGYLDLKERTFAQALRSANYRTGIAGKWQLSGTQETIEHFGFEQHLLWNMHAYRPDHAHGSAGEPASWKQRYFSPTLYRDGKWFAYGSDRYGPDLCTEFLIRFAKKHAEEPFLLYYPMILTHDPFIAAPDSKLQDPELLQPRFASMVFYMDFLVGRILEELDRLGLAEQTLVLFTADNGSHRSISTDTTFGRIRGGKSLPLVRGMRVPLIARWPGKIAAGSVCEDLIDFSDFFPTLLEAAEVSLAEDWALDGRSFLPRLLGRPYQPREWIFCHYWHRGRDAERVTEFVQTKRWKLHADGTLYDLKADPDEQKAMKAEDQETVEIRNQLQKALNQVRHPVAVSTQTTATPEPDKL